MYNFAHFGFIRSYKTTRPILLLVCNTLRFLDTSATSTPCTAISATTVPFPRPGRILSSRIPGQVSFFYFFTLFLPQFLQNNFPFSGLSGDKDPLDVCEIGFSPLPTGSVVQVSHLPIRVPWFRSVIYQSGFHGSGQASVNQGSVV